MHRSVIFQWMLFGLLAGIGVASFLVLPMAALWGGLLLGALCLLARGRAMIVGCVLLAFTLGMWRTQIAVTAPSLLWNAAEDKPMLTMDGYVSGDFSPTKSGGQFQFHVMRIGDQSVNDDVVIFGTDSLRPRYGQVLSITGKLQQPKNSGDFDYISYLAKNGAHALVYFPEYSVPTDLAMPWPLRTKLAIIGRLHNSRDALAASIARAVRLPESSYLAGILVGAKGIVSQDIQDAFARTGTSHILAISGYNITVVMSVMLVALAPLGRRRAFWLAVLGISTFTFLVGAGASVVRAAVMGILALCAQQFGRTVPAGTAIMLSAALMCLYNPLLLRWDVGFQLSFLALVGIVYIEPIILPALKKILRWDGLAQTAATTIAASVMVLPLLLFIFGTLAIYTLPANLLVLPLVPLAMALGFATGVAGLIFPWLGALVGQVAWLVAAIQLGVIQFFANLPHAALQVNISVSAFVTAYAGLAGWLISHYISSSVPTLTKENHA